MGAEKWLDIELWDSAEECFQVLRSRGYRIATTHVGIEAVSMDFIHLAKGFIHIYETNKIVFIFILFLNTGFYL